MNLQEIIASAVAAIQSQAAADVAAAQRLEAEQSAATHNAALDGMRALGGAMADASERVRKARLEVDDLARQREATLANVGAVLAQFATTQAASASAYESARRAEADDFLGDRPARIGDVVLRPDEAVAPTEDGTAQATDAIGSTWPERDASYWAAVAESEMDAEDEARGAARMADIEAAAESKTGEAARLQEDYGPWPSEQEKADYEADEEAAAARAANLPPVLASMQDDDDRETIAEGDYRYYGPQNTPEQAAEVERQRVEAMPKDADAHVAAYRDSERVTAQAANSPAATKPTKVRKPRKKS